MGKAFRKPRPSAPHWHYYDNDCCWYCSSSLDQHACSNCKDNKRLSAELKKKRKRIEKQKFKKDYNDY